MTQSSYDLPQAVPAKDGAAPGNASASSELLDFERLWIQALELKYWLAGIIAAGLIIGIVVTLLATEIYRASARIEISLTEENVTGVAPLESQGRGPDRLYMTTQIELLTSTSITERVVEAGNLTRDPEFLAAFDRSETSSLSTRDAAGILRRNIEISTVPEFDID